MRVTLTDSRYGAVLCGAISFGVLIALWQILASTGVINEFLLSSPALVVKGLRQMASSGQLGSDIGVSMLELGISFGMAAVVGLVVGIISGWYRSAEYAVSPFVALGYSAPFVALYPVFVVILGIGRPTVIAIGFLIGVFPIIVNTARGVQSVDPKLIQVARSFGARDPDIFRKIMLPATLGPVMAGMRLGIGQCLLGVIVGELFAGQSGIGYAISYYGGLLKTNQMLAAVIVVGVLGVVLTAAVSLIEQRLSSWRPEAGGPR